MIVCPFTAILTLTPEALYITLAAGEQNLYSIYANQSNSQIASYTEFQAALAVEYRNNSGVQQTYSFKVVFSTNGSL